MSKLNLLTVLLSVVLSAVVAWSLRTTAPQTTTTQVESVYDRILRTKTLRCAYSVYRPSFFKDANTGAPDGIMYDLTEALAKQLDLKVEWVEEVGYGEMMAGLEAHRYDMICSGKWVYMPQGRGAEFSAPIFVTPFYAYARADDMRFDADLSILNAPEYTISTRDGTVSADLAQSDFPKAKTVDLPTLADESEMLMNVVSKKADVVFLDTATLNTFLTNNPGTLRIVNPQHPLKNFETAYMFLSGEPRLAALVNGSLRQFNDEGLIDRILTKYEPVPGTFLRPAIPYRAP